MSHYLHHAQTLAQTFKIKKIKNQRFKKIKDFKKSKILKNKRF
jgi:hypothetical protein